MALADITRAAVLEAIEECDRLGREAFRSVHGFGPARRYVLVHNDKPYDSTAIAGVAHGYLPGKRPLRSTDFSGGEDRVARLLRRLGFMIGLPADLTREELLRVVSSLSVSRAGGQASSHQPITLLWAIGRACRGDSRITSWPETEQSVRTLLERYARTGERPRPDYPVAALFHAGLWELRGFTGPVPPASGDTRLRRWFDANEPDGGLADPADRLIRHSGQVRAEVIALITNTYLGDLDCNDLLADVGLSAGQPPRRFWTLAADPTRFRVADAVRDLDEDWWRTGGADVHAGDRFAIWKYKGRDNFRGIIAFGEVLTEPEIREEPDDVIKYWTDPDGTAPAPRVLVSYAIKPPQPLWLEHAPADSVIRQLPVSRAHGGTAHHVTADQWTQLMTLVGGWPSQPAIWTVTEIQFAVAAYFSMLRAELAGVPYVKADVYGEVQTGSGRSPGSAEDKFANISAVLSDIGLPHLLGYEPRSNYQQALRAEVEHFLTSDTEIQRLLENMPAPGLPPTAKLVEVDPPVMEPPGAGGRGRTVIGVDYMGRLARNRAVGLTGEILVVEHERARLAACGRPDLAERVAHVPSTLGDGAGYDVGSFLADGSPHHIEVKATCGGIATPFFLSAGELGYALNHPGTYSIYRIFNLGPNPGFYKLTGDMREVLDLTPVSYQARVRSPGAPSTGQDAAGNS